MAAIAVGQVAAAHAAPVDHVVNGGFESGMSAWSTSSTNVVGGGCDTAWVVGSTGSASGCAGFAPYGGFVSPHGGLFAAYNSFDGDGPQTIRLFQTFEYTAAHGVSSVILDWWDAVGFGSGWTFPQPRVFSVEATIDGQFHTVFSESFPNDGRGRSQGWQQTTLDLTELFRSHGAGTHTISLAFANTVPQSFTGPGSFALDDVRLRIDAAVPEPATLSLAALGIAAVLVARRRAAQPRRKR